MNFRDYPQEDYDVDSLFVEDQKKLIAGNSEVDFDGDPIPVGKYKDINFYKYSIAYVIAGVILGLAAMWTLIIPHRDKAADSSERNLKITYSQEIADKNVSISELTSKNDSLTEKLSQAESQVESLTDQIEKYGDYSKQVLSDEDQVKLQAAIFKYEDMTYETALEDLNKVLADSPESDVALYYKAMCYLKLSDNNNATLVFNQLVENCPNSVYYTVAASYADDDAIEAGKQKKSEQDSAEADDTDADDSQSIDGEDTDSTGVLGADTDSTGDITGADDVTTEGGNADMTDPE
jgi:tetratricopeptide (TPR) repeat protein